MQGMLIVTKKHTSKLITERRDYKLSGNNLLCYKNAAQHKKIKPKTISLENATVVRVPNSNKFRIKLQKRKSTD
eukprot:TRINITY_DN6354_c0_g1_i1.p1 TRINITY_DN6354_c0_g1~~TRINITY_DN6354_c0_g1_i1.p1  ORF type:complete len:74 (+),score=6.29 TRINITY_DN6354_c0_g1_i1:133-354(+)